MIIGTVTLLMMFFGGGGAFSFEKAFEPYVKDAVKDETRYEQVVELTKQADEQFNQFQTELNDVWTEELKRLLSDYDTTKEQFQAFIKKADQSRTAAQQGVLDIRMELKTVITEAEWNAMYAAIDKKLKEDLEEKEKQGK